MELYRHDPTEDVETVTNDLYATFEPIDIIGMIEVQETPEQAEKNFLATLLSKRAATEQGKQEMLSLQFPDKYPPVTPAGDGTTEYSVFKTDTGAKIIFITNYERDAIKRIFKKENMGKGFSLRASKMRNKFQPHGWNTDVWTYPAITLLNGDYNAFDTPEEYRPKKKGISREQYEAEQAWY